MDYINKNRTISHELVLAYERDGLSDAQIAGRLGLSRQRFSKIRRQMYHTDRSWARQFPGNRSDKGKVGCRVPVLQQLANRAAYMKAYRRANPEKTGYLGTRINGYQSTQTHRLMAKITIGRDLLPGEVVHHKDQDLKNNQPENLLIFKSQADHLAHHRGEVVDYIDLADYEVEQA